MQIQSTDPSAVGQIASNRIFQVMEHIEYRRIVTQEDFESIGELRTQAFDARTVYSRKLAGNAIDDSDRAPGAKVFGMYYDGHLAATLRINIVDRENPNAQSVRLFRSTLMPLIEQGMSFVDPSRFAVDEELSHDVPGITLLMLRVAFMATTYYNASACLALVKKEHAAFYRRVFRSTALAGPQEFEGFAIPLVLFASPRQNEADICRRYPLFYYTDTERRMLFETPSVGMPPLTVLPTAKLAMQAA